MLYVYNKIRKKEQKGKITEQRRCANRGGVLFFVRFFTIKKCCKNYNKREKERKRGGQVLASASKWQAVAVFLLFYKSEKVVKLLNTPTPVSDYIVPFCFGFFIIK